MKINRIECRPIELDTLWKNLIRVRIKRKVSKAKEDSLWFCQLNLRQTRR